jgi:hypothetical protein
MVCGFALPLNPEVKNTQGKATTHGQIIKDCSSHLFLHMLASSHYDISLLPKAPL